jgi:hypothetical protein
VGRWTRNAKNGGGESHQCINREIKCRRILFGVLLKTISYGGLILLFVVVSRCDDDVLVLSFYGKWLLLFQGRTDGDAESVFGNGRSRGNRNIGFLGPRQGTGIHLPLMSRGRIPRVTLAHPDSQIRAASPLFIFLVPRLSLSLSLSLSLLLSFSPTHCCSPPPGSGS